MISLQALHYCGIQQTSTFNRLIGISQLFAGERCEQRKCLRRVLRTGTANSFEIVDDDWVAAVCECMMPELPYDETSQIVDGVAMIESPRQTAPIRQSNLNGRRGLTGVNFQLFVGSVKRIKKTRIVFVHKGATVKVSTYSFSFDSLLLTEPDGIGTVDDGNPPSTKLGVGLQWRENRSNCINYKVD